MRIYIDEAGNFVPQTSGQSLFSLVLAVVIPSSIEPNLFGEFSALLNSWPHTGTEIKGSKLDETQAAQLIDLVARQLLRRGHGNARRECRQRLQRASSC